MEETKITEQEMAQEMIKFIQAEYDLPSNHELLNRLRKKYLGGQDGQD